jgi:murein DD-endopeptidase MepM/ murein hydrolase activator NlpD
VIAKLAAVAASTVCSAALLPLLMVPGATVPDSAGGPAACGPTGVILDTIRLVETGGDYQSRITTATASGAYGFVDGTWRHYAAVAGVDVARFPAAWMATPGDQDAAAAVHVNEILAAHDNQVEAVAVSWYLPAALDDPTLMDHVPFPQAGNRITVRQYQMRWMAVYQQKLTADPAGSTPGCSRSITADGRWALPAPRDILDHAGITSPHHDYPAVDLMMPAGTPVFAATSGVVARTTHFAANWFRDGCPHEGCATCGMGITIHNTDGLRHTYCHNSVIYVHDGDQVTAGQHIADSGDTGRSSAPHEHLEFRIGNIRYCPQPLLDALYNNETIIPAPTSLPTSGCST